MHRRFAEHGGQDDADNSEQRQDEERGCHCSCCRRFESVHTKDEDDTRDLAHDQEQDVRCPLRRRVSDLGSILKADWPGAEQEEAEGKT